MFAMFFIIIPLTGNIIKERQSGSILRLKLIPGSYLISMTAKIWFISWFAWCSFD